MRSPLHTAIPHAETTDFTDEIRRIFDDLDQAAPATLTGECSPPVDVHETDDTLEVTVDLPDVDRGAVRVVVKGQTLIVAGRKSPRRGRPDSSFHLVERGYGRFVRAVRLTVPCDTGRIDAILANGELRITLPKIAEQRGHAINVPVRSQSH